MHLPPLNRRTFNRVFRPTPTNVYHCTIPKGGSQWLRMLFNDERVLEACELSVYTYFDHLPEKNDLRNIHERSFDQPFPERTIVSPIYIDYDNFARIPKPRRYRAFFMMRDPRDVLVSYYFSMKVSHKKIGGAYLERIRARLNELPEPEGMAVMVGEMVNSGFFIALRSWLDAPRRDRRVMLVKYEEMLGEGGYKVFRKLFRHCRLHVPAPDLREVVEHYSFDTLSGRKPGEEDVRSHFRKGVAGDWRNYFDEMLTERFKEASGDLVERLGYGW